ncbi:MAG: ATP-binding protein [Syntrophotaleaceae bacterium]
MQIYRPKSFLALVLIGFAVVATPLLLALVNAEFFMGRLADRSSQAIYRSIDVIQASRSLVEDLVGLERRARQYQVLREPELLGDLEQTHERLGQTLEHLLTLPLDEDQKDLLRKIRQEEDILFQSLQSPPSNGEEVDSLWLEKFAILHNLARQIYDNSQKLIVQEVEAVQEATTRARKILIWLPPALIPLTVAFVVVFTLLIAKPIRQINQGINRLGEGDFKSPIRVSGPRDLEFLGRRLDWLRLRLGEVEREKSRFVAHVSHELKTPLASIREGSQLLVEEAVGPLSEQQREVAGILQKNSLQLQKLIDNLLGFSRSQARIAPFQPVTVDLCRLAEMAIADHRAAIMKKDLDLELILNPVQLPGDPERLRIVVDNLLSNAVKFAPQEGKIILTTRSEGRSAIIEVADSGPGIAEEEREIIYQPFYQGRTPFVGPVKGTGLGLSIVREYVRDHGGKVEQVSSSLGGACFRVSLPLGEGHETSRKVESC